MPPDDALRQTLGVGALAGGAVFGLYSLAERLLGRKPVQTQDVILALLNVGSAILTGFLVAYFVGPALTPLIPMQSLRDPYAVGFGIGAVAWESVPLVLRLWRRFVEGQARSSSSGEVDR